MPDAPTVLAPLPDELSLLMADVVAADAAELDRRWRAAIGPTFERLDLPMPPAMQDAATARTKHSDAFRWLHGEFTTVRRIDPEASW